MKLTIAIPVMGQLETTKAIWGCHIANIEDKVNTELLVIDNGSTDGYAEWLEKFVFPHFPDHRIIRHDENIGLVPTMNEIWKEAKGEVIAILHNDLFVYEHGWDQKVLLEFQNDNVGMAGFFGSLGIGTDGGRIGSMSNFIEAEIHGERRTASSHCVAFDGIALICRKAMLDQIGGFDTGLGYHHFYDKLISLDSYTAGWKHKHIGILCHHLNGVTANRSDYQAWADKKAGTTNNTGDLTIYKQSESYMLQKYAGKLPVILGR